MNDSQLAAQLEVWFKNNLNNKNRWCDTYTGKVIKQNLMNLSNWKNAPRGNPSLGGKISKLKKVQ